MTNLKCAGFLYINDRVPTTDPQDLYDFIGKKWTPEELKFALTGDVLPEGMILQGGKEPQVVKRSHFGGLSLRNLNSALQPGAE